MAALEPSLAAYVTITALLVVTPGASTAVIVRHAIDGGRSAGMAAASGIAAANTAWAVAAGVGVTAMLTRVPAVFSALRFAGAGYLFFLALCALTRAWRPPPVRLPAPEPAGGGGSSDASARNPARWRGPFREGVMVNLLNPPVAAFYVVIVPSFLPAPAAPGRFVLFSAIHVVLAFACHAAWAWGFDRLRAIWTRPAARRSIEAITGIALLAIAARMLE